MADDAANFKVCNTPKLHSGLTKKNPQSATTHTIYRYGQAKETTVQRITGIFNANCATINFDLRRIKVIFVANNALNESFYTSKRQLARIYLEQ
jgi:hypothetical protein